MRISSFGEDHPYTLAAMLNLGLTYWDQGRMTEAAELEEAVLHRRIGIFGSDDADTLTVMHNLGSTYRDLGRLTEARTLQELVLRKRGEGFWESSIQIHSKQCTLWHGHTVRKGGLWMLLSWRKKR